jgi:predicted transcriptional regulator
MDELKPVQGDLQVQVMSALWRLGNGTVEQVRAALPVRYRGAYNTIQTVLNRLSDRGLVVREKRSVAIEYRPALTEADYLSRTIEQALAGASLGTRQTVLARLIDRLREDELEQVQRLARTVAQKRGRS